MICSQKSRKKIFNILKEIFSENSITEEHFFNLIKRGFAHKRKKLRKNLGCDPETLEKASIDVDARAEDVMLRGWIALAQLLA